MYDQRITDSRYTISIRNKHTADRLRLCNYRCNNDFRETSNSVFEANYVDEISRNPRAPSIDQHHRVLKGRITLRIKKDLPSIILLIKHFTYQRINKC